MPEVPASQHTTAEAVIRWRAKQPQEHREHLGASLIGHECDRHLWLSFRWAVTPTWEGRMLRLFDRGKREEAVVIEELRGIGVELHADQDGQQIDCRDESGHFGGSVEGVGRGYPEGPKSWAILEVKTHNSKSFTQLRKLGVAEAKPQHYAQMQAYMGLLDVPRALYFAVNKDNDEIHTEWVHFDEETFKALQARALRIIDATQPPEKLSQDPAHFICKGCQHFSLCHEQKVAEVSCRTCCHATPGESGAWRCELHGRALDKAAQRSACDSHLFIPALVPFGRPVDGGVAHVEYEHVTSGKRFINGPGHYGSRELAASCAEVVTEPVVEAMRATFNAKVTTSRKRRGPDLSKLPPAADEPFVDDKEIPF